ncbi:hypothetical protein [Kordia sp.]|uniref:hypothetical protein n=1 Tax=Kordia sp. TaxID=1965332 RepID=UPI0025C2886E|nr:hypothetical protein [Kordia sp.]MCH2197000.1 hypothetical protein [Kordia sp.]
MTAISNEVVRHIGELDGWEYIVAPKTIAAHRREVTSINDSVKPRAHTLETFDIPENCKVINLSGKKHIHRITELDKN